jgi:hypothetical protein
MVQKAEPKYGVGPGGVEYMTEDLSEKYGIVCRVEEITPEIANRYIARNTGLQRKISRRALESYVSELNAGGWQLNGEAIVFGKSGLLLNGQHRLVAIMKSGKPMTTLVVYGIDDSKVYLYDLQLRRSAKNTLQVMDINISPIASAAAKSLVGLFQPIGDTIVNEYIRKHQDDLNRAYNCCCTGAMSRYSKRTSCVLVCYLMLRTNTAQKFELETFFNIYNTKDAYQAGKDYKAGPALKAREMCDMYATSKRRTIYQMEVLTQALEDFMAGRDNEGDYQVNDTESHWKKYATEVRKMDGLE